MPMHAYHKALDAHHTPFILFSIPHDSQRNHINSSQHLQLGCKPLFSHYGSVLYGNALLNSHCNTDLDSYHTLCYYPQTPMFPSQTLIFTKMLLLLFTPELILTITLISHPHPLVAHLKPPFSHEPTTLTPLIFLTQPILNF